MKIAVILTVFNRKQKTISCLQHLFEAQEHFNKEADREMDISVFLTDDGSTDGTAEAVKMAFADKSISILQGTGSLFWAGGMRLAWQASIDCGTHWDYYLLLNDDTFVYNNVFAELLVADEYGFKQTGRHGLSSGITCQPGYKDDITYGGFVFKGKAKGVHVLVQPVGKPQIVDMTHANILLVHRDMVLDCGIFYNGFIHGCADEDYSLQAKQCQRPVVVTGHTCGECECDHDSSRDEIERLMTMTLAERKRFVNSPTHSDHDYLLYVRRNLPLRYPVAWLLRSIRVYCPKLYYRITNFRGVYK